MTPYDKGSMDKLLNDGREGVYLNVDGVKGCNATDFATVIKRGGGGSFSFVLGRRIYDRSLDPPQWVYKQCH